MPSTNGHGPK
jgi:site-specific DNA recombinase